MERIFTSLLLLTVLMVLDGGAAVPIPDKEAITLILEALLQEANAEPAHQDVQKVNTIAQQFPMESQQWPMESQQWPMESQKFPMESQQFPMESQQFPMKYKDDEQIVNEEEQNMGNINSEIKKYLQRFMQQQQQKSNQEARAQEKYNNHVRAQNLGGAMGYERAKQYAAEAEDENALDLARLQYIIQRATNQGWVGGRPGRLLNEFSEH